MTRFWSHHNWHFLAGFMLEPRGHRKSSLKSFMLENGPLIRKRESECSPYLILKMSTSIWFFSHHTLALLNQNICRGVYSWSPGSRGSKPCLFSKSLYALYAMLNPPLSEIFSLSVWVPLTCGKHVVRL